MRAAKIRTEIRREQIAEAAMDLVASGGLSAVSLAGIAKRIGIVPSAVYRHYSGKEEVFDAVLERLRERMLANVEAACDESSDALEQLHGLLVRHVDMLTENPAFPHVVFAHFASAESEERWSHLRATMCTYLDAIEGSVAAGQGAGRIRAEVRPRTAAVMFIGLILPAAMLDRLSAGEFDAAAHADAAWPVFRRGLAAD